MRTVTDIAALRALLAEWRRSGERVVLVPTMGNLHAGHLSLVEQAKDLAGRVVVSLFVNPLQFDRAEDLKAYPRTFEDDRLALERMEVDLLFAPEVSAMYPQPAHQLTRVEVPGLSALLEGASRPGHFAGVATVVIKLFNLIQPDTGIFGVKDYQQLLIIRRLVADLDVPVEIRAGATVREADGLALSSRNRHLDAEQRRCAPELYRTLCAMADALKKGQNDYVHLEREASQRLQRSGLTPDYVVVRRKADLVEPAPGESGLIVLGAAWLGATRLIDNVEADPGD